MQSDGLLSLLDKFLLVREAALEHQTRVYSGGDAERYFREANSAEILPLSSPDRLHFLLFPFRVMKASIMGFCDGALSWVIDV